MSLKLSGLNPLSYMGVEPSSPPQLILKRTNPTPTDWQNFNLGTIWLNQATEQIWMLVSLVSNVATWVLIGVGPSGDVDQFTTQNGIVFPLLGNVNIVTSNTTVKTNATVANTITIEFDANANNNVGLGSSLPALTSGSDNTSVGSATLEAVTSGNNNTIVGAGSAELVTTGSNNTVLGAGSVIALTTGSSNIAIGFNAANHYTGAESSNIIINNLGIVGESNVVRIGLNTDGTGNPKILINPTNLKDYVCVGDNTLTNVTTADSVIAIGNKSLRALTTGNNNVAIGTLALTSLTTGQQNVGIGDASLGGLITGTGNISIGLSSGTNYTGAESNNILIQNQGVLGESNAIRIGVNTDSTGAPNILVSTNPAFVAIGNNTLSTSPTGSLGATAIGNNALRFLTTGVDNTALGQNSLEDVTTGGFNVALGDNTLFSLLTGSSNIAIGHLAGSSYTGAESSNICIGNSGVLGETNTIRIGVDGSGSAQQDVCIIAGNVIAARALTAGTSVYAGGDSSGTASFTALTNVSDLTANSTGTFTILSKTANNLNSSGFIKIYIGVTAYYIPVFSTTTP